MDTSSAARSAVIPVEVGVIAVSARAVVRPAERVFIKRALMQLSFIREVESCTIGYTGKGGKLHKRAAILFMSSNCCY